MQLKVLWPFMGLLVLRARAQASDCGAEEEEKKGKVGFCAASPKGLYEPPCQVDCEGDSECPRDQKCCEWACNYLCVPPSQEKPGLCPAPLMKKLHGPLTCETTCEGDAQCRGPEKCCETGCGRVCRLPLEEKPGKCPRRQRIKKPLEGFRLDTCIHDRECPPEEKCCFTGYSMSCVNVQQESHAARVS